MPTTLVSNVAHPFESVKSPINIQLPLIPRTMIHHNVDFYRDTIVYSSKGHRLPQGYGVSSSLRLLSPGLLLKRLDQVSDCLEHIIGLSQAQREVVLRLLRLHAYYGQVYPKADEIACNRQRIYQARMGFTSEDSLNCTGNPGCSHATYWRTIRKLKDRGLLQVVNRFIIRPHAQISNLYKLDRLLILIARWLAEHGEHFAAKWLEPYLHMAGSLFWRRFTELAGGQVADPGGVAR